MEKLGAKKILNTALKAALLIVTFVFSACGEDCLFDCDVPKTPSDCSTLTETEIKRFDSITISYMEDDEFVKALEILDCYKEVPALFNDGRKLRWLTAKLESNGFDTIFGLISVLQGIGELVSDGATTLTSLSGVPNINSRTQASYFSLVNELKTVRDSVNSASLNDNQLGSYNSLSTIIAVYILNSYSYPDLDSTVIAGLYTDIQTQVSSVNESYVTTNLLCVFSDDSGSCPDGSEPTVASIALVLANQFYVP